MNSILVLLAAATPFSARLADPLEWLYPDSPAVVESAFSGTDVPSNGVADVNLLVSGLRPGVPLEFAADVPGGEWYRQLDVNVMDNTGPGAQTEHQNGGYYRNDFVTRRAPFRVFDVLEPLSGPVVPTGTVVALRWRLGCLPAGTGAFTAKLSVRQGDETRILPFTVTVHPVALPAVGRDSFKYTCWLSFTNIATRHGLEPWSEAHFAMIEKYVRLAVKGRQNMEWVHVKPFFSLKDGRVVLDAERLDRVLDIYRRAGVYYVEGGHVAGHTDGKNQSPTFSTVLGGKVTTTPEGRAEIEAIIGHYRDVAVRRGLADRWYQHVADEPFADGVAAYLDTCRIVRSVIPKNRYPKMRLVDAICDKNAMWGLDVITPQNHVWEQNRGHYESFVKDHPKGLWCYTCLAPGGKWMNRLMDMELLRPALLPWCCVLNGIDGYLHWGYNMYGKDQNPFEEGCLANFSFDGSCTLPAGDTHIVYPGKDGPWPSVRMEALRAGLEDADLLTMLRTREPERADRIILRLVRGFGDYTADPALYRKARRELLKALSNEPAAPRAAKGRIVLTDASLLRMEDGKLEGVEPKEIVLETGAAERTGVAEEGVTVLARALRIRDTLATLLRRFPQARVKWLPVFAEGLAADDPMRIRGEQVHRAVVEYVKALKCERLSVAPVDPRHLTKRTLSYSETPVVAPHWMVGCSSTPGLSYEARFEKKLFDVKFARTVDVVMLGDSITHRFEMGDGCEVWQEMGREFSLLNLGFGGDQTQHLLWNIRYGGILDGYRARVVTLMIGTNNWEGDKEVAAGIRLCLDEIRRRQPQAKVVLLPILQRLADRPLWEKNERVNAMIRPLADGKDVVWLDLRPIFEGRPEDVKKSLLPDGTHPNAEAYRRCWEAMRPVLKPLVSCVRLLPLDDR